MDKSSFLRKDASAAFAIQRLSPDIIPAHAHLAERWVATPSLQEWAYIAEPWEGSIPSAFPEASADLRIISVKTHVSVLGPTKAVIGSCLPSSGALLLRAQMTGSQSVIITRDAFLRSLLSRPPRWSVMSSGRAAPPAEAGCYPEYPQGVFSLMQYPTSEFLSVGPRPSARWLHRVPMHR